MIMMIMIVMIIRIDDKDNKDDGDDDKQIITVGEGDGTNYLFRGKLDVTIFPKRS